MASYYPLRRYAKDLLLWVASTDIPDNQMGPAAVLQLSSGARALADEITLADLQQGVTADWADGMGHVPHHPIHNLLRILAGRFGEMEVETVIRAMIDFLEFQRHPSEDIDLAITRYDILYSRAREHSALDVSCSVLAYLLLNGLCIPASKWPMLFMTWGGSFPTADAQFRQLKTQIRQQAHLTEPGPQNISNMQGRKIHSTQAFFGQQDEQQPWTWDGTEQWNAGYAPGPGKAYFGNSSHFENSQTTFSDTGACVYCGDGAGQSEAVYPFDTDTDDDDGEDQDADILAMLASQRDPNEIANELGEAYLIAKKR